MAADARWLQSARKPVQRSEAIHRPRDRVSGYGSGFRKPHGSGRAVHGSEAAPLHWRSPYCYRQW
jgi:hypothetical protein